MQARFVVTAAAALTIAGSAFAEPAKTPPAEPSRPTHPPAVVLASAEQPTAVPTAADQPAPVKRPRVARVTTCRCADQQAQDQQ